MSDETTRPPGSGEVCECGHTVELHPPNLVNNLAGPCAVIGESGMCSCLVFRPARPSEVTSGSVSQAEGREAAAKVMAEMSRARAIINRLPYSTEIIEAMSALDSAETVALARLAPPTNSPEPAPAGEAPFALPVRVMEVGGALSVVVEAGGNPLTHPLFHGRADFIAAALNAHAGEAPDDMHLMVIAAILRGEVPAESFDCDTLATTIDRLRILNANVPTNSPAPEAPASVSGEPDGDWAELRRLIAKGYVAEAASKAGRMAIDSPPFQEHKARLRREGRNPTDCIECGVGDGSHAIGCPRATPPAVAGEQE